MMVSSYFRIALFGLLLFGSIPAGAAEIKFSLYQQSTNENITVRIENQARQQLFLRRLDVEFDNKHDSRSVVDTIQAGQSKEYQFKISFPAKAGSYPVIASIVYLNDGREFSLRNLGIYNFMESVPPGTKGSTGDVRMVEEGKIIVQSANPAPWRLVLPYEIEVVSSQTLGDKKVFNVRAHADGFSNRYAFYAIAEDTFRNKHRTAFCSGQLYVDGRQARKGNGRIPPFALLCSAMVFLCFVYFMRIRIVNRPSRAEAALFKYSSRMFLLTLSYLLLQNMSVWVSGFAAYIGWKPMMFVAERIASEYRGPNFDLFFHYFVDLYFFSSLFLLYPYLYFREDSTDTKKDKYSSLLLSLLSFLQYPSTRKIHWSPESRLGLLVCLVKFVFLPIMTTWVIEYTFRQVHMTRSFQWDFAYVNAYLVALCLYIDTSIFGFGYLFESKSLKSEIKSVEPTILGWVVCLWCYPPFNSLSWKPFEYQIIDVQHNYPQWVLAGATVVITMLWGIYAWATVALGFKASNLTNRGIVDHGPYRYVRHPAYAAKVTLWWIQGFLFGRFLLGILLADFVIYSLRALTEERHLSRDPDYLAYCRRVRYRFFPGLF
jgi:protein-S-isoprenylcysteine O-methyltransferase Ste14